MIATYVIELICQLQTLYSVGDSWTNEYGTIAEWKWQGGKKPKNAENNMPQCLFFHHKPHTDWPKI
jgi:hypothetical protein